MLAWVKVSTFSLLKKKKKKKNEKRERERKYSAKRATLVPGLTFFRMNSVYVRLISGNSNGHNSLYNAVQSWPVFLLEAIFFLLFSDSTVLVINPRTYMQIHTPTVVQGGVDGPPPPRLFDMLQYFETILPSRDAITVMRMRAVCLFWINLLGQH